MRPPALLSRLAPAGSRRDNLENPSVDLVQALIAITDGTTVSAVSLTPYKALRLTSVYACIRVIAESIASLPVIVRAGDEESRSRMVGDPREQLLNVQPNPEQTPMEVIETWIANALLWGRGYLYVVRNGAGLPIELWGLRPDRTWEHRMPDGSLYYTTTLRDGSTKPLRAEDVIPLKSIFGLSPVMATREAIAGVIAADEYAFRFWANNARPGGVIETDQNWDDQEFSDFSRRWRSGHEGLKRSHLLGILTGGAKWADVGVPPQMAQMLETRAFGIREITRVFRVPPHMVGDLAGTVTRASIEQQSIEFVVYTLRSWLVRAEQALRVGLFMSKEDQKNQVYAEFVTEGLMRGDIKSRYDAYALGVQWGWLSRADVRRFEQLPSIDDQQLDQFLVPLNLGTSTNVAAKSPAKQGFVAETASSLTYLALLLRGQPGGEEALAACIAELQRLRAEMAAGEPEPEPDDEPLTPSSEFGI
ncbi:MAG TPA: phage portal protein [Gaiellaceae bacterium]|nr:phage portal protein [Gaiellaceae bacterium]